jgi:hypothetical protein
MRSSSSAGQKPRRYEGKDAIMKISVIFGRKKKARPPRRTETVEMLTNWTTRDWTDLPVHHPRQD